MVSIIEIPALLLVWEVKDQFGAIKWRYNIIEGILEGDNGKG